MVQASHGEKNVYLSMVDNKVDMTAWKIRSDFNVVYLRWCSTDFRGRTCYLHKDSEFRCTTARQHMITKSLVSTRKWYIGKT